MLRNKSIEDNKLANDLARKSSETTLTGSEDMTITKRLIIW